MTKTYKAEHNELAMALHEAQKKFNAQQEELAPWQALEHPSYSLNSFEQVVRTVAKWSK